MMNSIYPNVEKFEQKARQILEGDALGFKPWLSYVDDIEFKRVYRVFSGINPGGTLETHEYDQAADYLGKPRTTPGWNAYLDERYPGGNPYQESVPALFKAMYGLADYRSKLRRAACFNMCPFRTRTAAELPVDAKRRSAAWWLSVVSYIQPQFIVSMGNSESPLGSPWGALGRRFA